MPSRSSHNVPSKSKKTAFSVTGSQYRTGGFVSGPVSAYLGLSMLIERQAKEPGHS